LSESRIGFEVPVRAEKAKALPLESGDWIELRAIGRKPGMGGGVPNRLQICRWRPDRSLVGTLWRPGDAGPEVAYELRPPIPTAGLQVTGTAAVHAQDTVGGRWRIRFVSERGRVTRVRYVPSAGHALPIQRGQALSLQVLPPDPLADLRGLAVIFQSPDGAMVATINAGARLTSELLDGIDVSPSGRLVYTDMRQLPSLCVARIEHQKLKVRSDDGIVFVSPGTHTRFVHGDKTYRFVGHDAALRAVDDPCGEETHQHLSYVITLEDDASPVEETTTP
jgi:hypothetical protein